MDDWRLRGQEDDLLNETLYKIIFPEFWKRAYQDKNRFFRMIEQNAKKHVEATNRWHEFLEGEEIQHFWHEHCAFCWEKALTDKEATFYCTEDFQWWICEECFLDFKEKFHWEEKTEDDLSL